MAELQLTTAEGFFKGASSGPVVVAGDPASSRLIRAVSYQEKIKMPPTGKLSDEQIEALTEWGPDGRALAERGVGKSPGRLGPGEEGRAGPEPDRALGVSAGQRS